MKRPRAGDIWSYYHSSYVKQEQFYLLVEPQKDSVRMWTVIDLRTGHITTIGVDSNLGAWVWMG